MLAGFVLSQPLDCINDIYCVHQIFILNEVGDLSFSFWLRMSLIWL